MHENQKVEKKKLTKIRHSVQNSHMTYNTVAGITRCDGHEGASQGLCWFRFPFCLSPWATSLQS